MCLKLQRSDCHIDSEASPSPLLAIHALVSFLLLISAVLSQPQQRSTYQPRWLKINFIAISKPSARAVYGLIHLCLPNYWSVSEKKNGSQHNLIPIFSDVSGTLRKMIIQALRHRTPPPNTTTSTDAPLPSPVGSPVTWLPMSSSVWQKWRTTVSEWGASLEWNATADASPSAGKQQGVVFGGTIASVVGGRGGVKQTHPTAQIDGLCCSLSVIHTDRQTDGGKSGDKLCFYACSVSHFTVFHTKSLPVLGERDFAVLMVL